MRSYFKIVAILPVAAAALGWSSVASADRVTVETTETTPRSSLLYSGVMTFGIPYVASIIVASESAHQGDGHLWVPIAGPWMDLTDRGAAPPAGYPGHDAEIANRVFIAIDGVFQAVGALQVVSAFLFPMEVEHASAEHQPKTAFRVTPMRLGMSGYGLGTVGSF